MHSAWTPAPTHQPSNALARPPARPPTLCRSEFVAGLVDWNQLQADRQWSTWVAQAFARLDRNNDGYIRRAGVCQRACVCVACMHGGGCLGARLPCAQPPSRIAPPPPPPPPPRGPVLQLG